MAMVKYSNFFFFFFYIIVIRMHHKMVKWWLLERERERAEHKDYGPCNAIKEGTYMLRIFNMIFRYDVT